MENYSHLQQLTGWSDTILRAIGSEEEALIYLKAGLIEKTVNGRQALTNPSIDGRAFNCRKEWLKEKLADYDSWKGWNNAELTYWQHMTDGNNAILHPKRESEIDRQQFDKEKGAHWMARFNDFKDCY